MGRYRVTVDTGGTFSDFVYLNEETGEVSISKVPSTPDDPSRAILHGIEMLLAKGVRADDISYFCHGTTVGTNALLEGKGVRTGLLVTEGFRAIYPVGEQARPYGAAIFDVMYDKPLAAGDRQRDGRSEGARRFPRQRAAGAGRGGAAANSPRAKGAEGRIHRGLPAVFIPASAAREARGGDHPRGNAGLRDFAFVGNSAADPRVLPAEHDGDQRLPAADPRALHRSTRAAADWSRVSTPNKNTSCSRTAACRPSTPLRARR